MHGLRDSSRVTDERDGSYVSESGRLEFALQVDEVIRLLDGYGVEPIQVVTADIRPKRFMRRQGEPRVLGRGWKLTEATSTSDGVVVMVDGSHVGPVLTHVWAYSLPTQQLQAFALGKIFVVNPKSRYVYRWPGSLQDPAVRMAAIRRLAGR